MPKIETLKENLPFSHFHVDLMPQRQHLQQYQNTKMDPEFSHNQVNGVQKFHSEAANGSENFPSGINLRKYWKYSELLEISGKSFSC